MSGYFTDTVNHVFCVDQAATTAMAITTGTISTNVVDCQANPTLRDLSITPMFAEFIVTEAFTAAADGGAEFTALTVEVKSDSTANLATSATVLATKSIPIAQLTLGARFVLALQAGQVAERYLGVWFTSVAELATAGKISAYLVPDALSMQYFPDGSSIVAG